MTKHWLLGLALVACGDSKATPGAVAGSGSAPAAKAVDPSAPTPAAAAPAAKVTGVLERLTSYDPGLPPNATSADLFDAKRIATEKGDQKLLFVVGSIPPDPRDAFALDVRMLGELDLGLGRMTKETITEDGVKKALAHYAKTPTLQLRGYRRRGHKLFVAMLTQPERDALAAETVAYVKEHGFNEPPNANTKRAEEPPEPPLVKAKWERDAKLYPSAVLRTYGKLAWLMYAESGHAWQPVAELVPPQPEGIEPIETCAYAVGDKVKAAWSTGTRNANGARTERSPGTVTEVYKGLAKVKFTDGNHNWAHCTTEIDKR